MVNERRLINTFLDLVKISSPSGQERNVADYILKQLEDIDVEVYEDSCGKQLNTNCGNIIIRISGKSNKKVLFSAHMDTVTPCEKVNPVVEKEIIRSDKTTILGADDKAGIANLLEMIRVMKEKDIEHPEIIIVFSVSEETGLHGAKNIDLSKFGKIDYGYILDGGNTPGTCYNMAPYSAKGVLNILGREAHAGSEPEKGINALVVASEAITKLKIGRIDEDTTCNMGIVEGGLAINIVMPEIKIHFEARSLYEKKLDDVLEEVNSVFIDICKKHNAKFINTVKKGTLGFNISEECETIKIFKKASENIGLDYKALPSGGGSDTNIYNMRGIESINIGIGMENVHTKDEYIKIDDLIGTTNLLLEIVKVID